jgi:cobalamin biosynthesis protein CobD/CbiB
MIKPNFTYTDYCSMLLLLTTDLDARMKRVNRLRLWGWMCVGTSLAVVILLVLFAMRTPYVVFCIWAILGLVFVNIRMLFKIRATLLTMKEARQIFEEMIDTPFEEHGPLWQRILWVIR